jgi:hypothetical protein
MFDHRRSPFALAAAAGTVLASLATFDACAVPVTPGGATVLPPGTSVASDPALAGTVIADVTAHWVSADDPMYGFPGAEGDLQSRVVREDATGTLDFYWRVTVYGPSYPGYVPTSLDIAGLSLESFLTGASFDADYLLDSSGDVPPAGVSAHAGTVFWDFDPSAFGPGSASEWLLLRSNTTTYYAGAAALLGESSITTFSPTLVPPPVPEPGGAALLLAGLAGLVVVRRRRVPRR